MQGHDIARRAQECEAAWTTRKQEAERLAAGTTIPWEAYQLSRLAEDARLHHCTTWRTPWFRERLSAEQNHRCCHCGKRMSADASDRDDRPSFEHILPRVAGGSDRPCNLAVACRRCNVDRAHRIGWVAQKKSA